jgi:hypothetical protein
MSVTVRWIPNRKAVTAGWAGSREWMGLTLTLRSLQFAQPSLDLRCALRARARSFPGAKRGVWRLTGPNPWVDMTVTEVEKIKFVVPRYVSAMSDYDGSGILQAEPIFLRYYSESVVQRMRLQNPNNDVNDSTSSDWTAADTIALNVGSSASKSTRRLEEPLCDFYVRIEQHYKAHWI